MIAVSKFQRIPQLAVPIAEPHFEISKIRSGHGRDCFETGRAVATPHSQHRFVYLLQRTSRQNQCIDVANRPPLAPKMLLALLLLTRVASNALRPTRPPGRTEFLLGPHHALLGPFDELPRHPLSHRRDFGLGSGHLQSIERFCVSTFLASKCGDCGLQLAHLFVCFSRLSLAVDWDFASLTSTLVRMRPSIRFWARAADDLHPSI